MYSIINLLITMLSAVLSRRQTVRVRASNDSSKADAHKEAFARIGDQIRSTRKKLLDQRKKLEDKRVANFRGLHDSFKKIVDEEVAFVKQVVAVSNEVCTYGKDGKEEKTEPVIEPEVVQDEE